MNFEKLKIGFLEGKKQNIFFKDGSNVFSHGLPLTLYYAVLEQEPSIEKYTEPDGSTPLFYVNTVKKFDRLVEHGFDIYAKDNDGVTLDQVYHPSMFVNLSDDALRGFKSKNPEFIAYYAERIAMGGSTVSDAEEEDNTPHALKTFLEAFHSDLREKSGEGSFGGSVDEDVSAPPLKMFLKVFRDELREEFGEGTDEEIKERFLDSFGGSVADEILEKFGDSLKKTSAPLVLHSKMIGHRPDLDNTSDHTPHSSKHDYVFTTDARNEFKTFTTKEGYEMIEGLAQRLQPMFEALRKSPDFDEKRGYKIYTEKENSSTGATWSDKEYADPSFIYQYCLNKSMQRFPETVEMMNAAFHLGILPGNIVRDTGVITVVSIGGGCAYELFAVKAIFAKYLPKVTLRLVSLDYEPLWGEVTKYLGIEFERLDFNKPVSELKSQLDPYKADFYVMSFVYRHYIKERHKDFIRYLCKSSFGIFVNDRNTEYLTFDMMSYKLSKSGFLTLISDKFDGYSYVEALTTKGFPESIYKDTPWSKPGEVRKSKVK